jgi:pimeloyl-ACP methyl ester carboxylesterase
LQISITPGYGKQLRKARTIISAGHAASQTAAAGPERISETTVNEMKIFTRVFIHGLDSSSRGTKGCFFRERYPGMLMEDYSGSLEERMARLERDLSGKENLILVGSSYGGLMAAIFACRNETRVRRLILLAPALGHADFSVCSRQPLQIPVTLYHGRFDDVVPPGPTRQIAVRLFANLDHHIVEDDHNLHRIFPTLDWDSLLEMQRKGFA